MTTGSFGAARLSDLTTALAGRYRLERELGAGGMATVWLAEDLRHERRVAIKVLHPELSAMLGPERFLAEIKTTANLQHPHILPLFDSGSAGGLLYYVMPYVAGETLRARLEREGQLPVADAVRLATQVADALEHAHQQGVVHRDVKPENVLLQEGHALVADFGIALAVTKAGGQRMTQTGLSLGTPQYMAPEQAMGERTIDARADVYALGAVTYETLAGEPPFTGPSAQAILAKLLTETPRAPTALRRTVPPHVEAAVLRALEKLPADRFASAADFAAALERPTTGPATPPVRHGAPHARRPSLALGAALVGAVIVAAWGWLRPPPEATPRAVRFTLALPDSAAVAPGPAEASLAFSPDGGTLVYVGGPARRLWVRPLDELTPRALAGTEGAEMPEVSPDGRWVAFLDGRLLKKVPLAGGAPVVVASDLVRFTWVSADSLIVARGQHPGETLWRVGADGGTPQRITAPQSAGAIWHTQPTALPGGRAILLTRFDSSGAPELAAMRLDDERVVPLGIRGTNPVYVPGGFLLFVRATDIARVGRPAGTVSAIRFDPEQLRVSGEAVDVIEDVILKPGGAEVAVSPDGALAYVPGTFGSRLVQVNRQGATQVLLSDVQGYVTPRVSPDGRRIALAIPEPAQAAWHIWVYDRVSTTMTRLTSGGRNVGPAWAPDGRRVAWTVTGGGPAVGVWWQPADGSTPPERLSAGQGVAFAPRGDALLTTVGAGDSLDLRLVPLRAGPTDRGRSILRASAPTAARLSPDGRWLAYAASQAGVREVYVQPFPGPGGRVQISSGGGAEPVWAPDGPTLFYRAGRSLVAATLATSPELAVRRRDTLFVMDAPPAGPVASYDVTPDGQQFVFPQFAGVASAPVVVLGWADRLRERFENKR